MLASFGSNVRFAPPVLKRVCPYHVRDPGVHGREGRDRKVLIADHEIHASHFSSFAHHPIFPVRMAHMFIQIRKEIPDRLPGVFLDESLDHSPALGSQILVILSRIVLLRRRPSFALGERLEREFERETRTHVGNIELVVVGLDPTSSSSAPAVLVQCRLHPHLAVAQPSGDRRPVLNLDRIPVVHRSYHPSMPQSSRPQPVNVSQDSSRFNASARLPAAR